MEPPAIRITVNGKLAYTVSQAADKLGIPPSRLRQDLAREPEAPQPVAPLDARTPLYDAKEIVKFGKRERPGKGSPGKPRRKTAAE